MVWLLVAGLIAGLLWTMQDRVKAYKRAAERAKERDQFAAKMRDFQDALEMAYKDIESAKIVLTIVRSSWRLEEPLYSANGPFCTKSLPYPHPDGALYIHRGGGPAAPCQCGDRRALHFNSLDSAAPPRPL
jgi:hypothetical protein